MKQREFDALWRSEAIRFSGGQFRLAVESFDDACRDGAQGEEPVEDQRPVPPQALGDFLHRRKAAAQGSSAPRLEELPCPCRAGVVPEPLEFLVEQMGPDALIVLQKLGELRGLVVREVLGPLEQAPAGTGESGLIAVPAQLGDVLPPHLYEKPRLCSA